MDAEFEPDIMDSKSMLRVEVRSLDGLVAMFCARLFWGFFFCPFLNKFSQMRLFWKDFKKWTLTSASWIAAPRLHVTVS
jgi:hypothetical protein